MNAVGPELLAEFRKQSERRPGIAGWFDRIKRRLRAFNAKFPDAIELLVRGLRILEALFPGRVDLGIGRAPGGDGRTALALQYGRGRIDVDRTGFEVVTLENSSAREIAAEVLGVPGAQALRVAGPEEDAADPGHARAVAAGRVRRFPRPQNVRPAQSHPQNGSA